MKKLSALFLSALILLVTSCSPPSPSDTVTQELEYLKNNPEEISGYMDEKILSKEVAQSLSDKLLDFDYTVEREEITGSNATVDVTITTYPFTEIFQTFSYSLAEEFSNNPNMDDSEISDFVNQLILNSLSKTEKNFTQRIAVNLEKEEGKWVIKNHQELSNALTGGLYEWTENE